jgi:hypothetical protein
MEYNFYIRPYNNEEDGLTLNAYDLEHDFGAKYVSFTGLTESGAIKNIYIEDFAETTESAMYIPEQKDLAHESTTAALTLLWTADSISGTIAESVSEAENAFYNFIKGRMIEYSDTFRKRFYELILIDAPKMVAERLYGGQQYREVTYTFKNIYGTSFAESQIS